MNYGCNSFVGSIWKREERLKITGKGIEKLKYENALTKKQEMVLESLSKSTKTFGELTVSLDANNRSLGNVLRELYATNLIAIPGTMKLDKYEAKSKSHYISDKLGDDMMFLLGERKLFPEKLVDNIQRKIYSILEERGECGLHEIAVACGVPDQKLAKTMIWMVKNGLLNRHTPTVKSHVKNYQTYDLKRS